MDSVLSVRDLKTYFHTEEGEIKAVDGLSYELEPGQILGIVGESGCGKSVHSLSILGLVPNPPGKIVGGQILFKGRNMKNAMDLTKVPVADLRAIRGSQIAMIFQEPMTSLNPVLTVGEQIAEAVRYHDKASTANAWKRAVELLGQVGIPHPDKRAHDFPHAFSGGMRQRAMIAMAMSNRPSVLIADEPTTALDVTVQAQILDLMRQLQKEHGTAIILITHNMGVVAETCDKVIVMYAGKPVEFGPVERIFSSPAHPYTRGLLNSIPKLNHKKSKLEPIEGQPPNLAGLGPGCSFAPRCPYSTEYCETQRPPLIGQDESHRAACWLLDTEAARKFPASSIEKWRKETFS